nr:ATP-binding protein [Nocardioides caldifontis]
MLETDEHLRLARHPAEAERARRHVAASCRDLHRDVAMIAQLLTSELVTNALEHGAGTIELSVTRSPGELRIDVFDESSEKPVSQAAGAAELKGRGMLIVETLASAWGVQSRPDRQGKSVWFILRTVT